MISSTTAPTFLYFKFLDEQNYKNLTLSTLLSMLIAHITLLPTKGV